MTLRRSSSQQSDLIAVRLRSIHKNAAKPDRAGARSGFCCLHSAPTLIFFIRVFRPCPGFPLAGVVPVGRGSQPMRFVFACVVERFL
ncbi:hypothetical protein RB7589 [Rhodopirellula baltica SH 1]|uniref:Uncharacterized protein n=1 Tax=Rhodopirellula baltica (strain DSM 10527 / NCIMB 13988 / SH1) TaxID=243090 RepID=Q7UNG7_RHOBA|nr:hypothetical protein RB7589 [Rhodopirellula baltica SH 1]